MILTLIKQEPLSQNKSRLADSPDGVHNEWARHIYKLCIHLSEMSGWTNACPTFPFLWSATPLSTPGCNQLRTFWLLSNNSVMAFWCPRTPSASLGVAVRTSYVRYWNVIRKSIWKIVERLKEKSAPDIHIYCIQFCCCWYYFLMSFPNVSI